MSILIVAERQEFLAAIRENPSDTALKLVFADWLEERGDPRAEFIRLQLQEQHTASQLSCMRELERIHRRKWAAEDLGIDESRIPLDGFFYFHRGCIWFPARLSAPSLQAAITAGDYAHTDVDITSENFRIHGSIQIDDSTVIYWPNREATSEGIVAELGSMGLVAGSLLHLLAMADWLEDRGSVVYMGSAWFLPDADRYYFPCIHSWRKGLRISLCWVQEMWGSFTSFAAVRAPSSQARDV